MVARLHHRGPDDNGTSVSHVGQAMVGFGHARLSIIDLSNAGHQPMTYKWLTITFNGEIYNFREIRSDLESKGHVFHSQSDTEVVLHAFEEWGADCVARFIGMFAFALLDQRLDRVYLFRDRAGVKPLFYYWSDGILLFGSELKALVLHPQMHKQIDINAVASFLRFGYVPAPSSIYQNTSKLQAGHYAIFDLEQRELTIERYWDAYACYSIAVREMRYEEAKDALRSLIKSAVNYRMVSDVPVGLFLSGGYDSAAVAAFLQSDRTQRIKTFTIGFHEGNNEAPDAKRIAEYLGTAHREYICTTREAQALIPSLPEHYDEPFGDSSSIPTMLVSSLARSEVTVALSADGGDELFFGYDTQRAFIRVNDMIERMSSHKITAALPSFLAGLWPRHSANRARLDLLGEVLSVPRADRPAKLREAMLSMQPSLFKSLMVKGDYQSSVFESPMLTNAHPSSVALAIDYRYYLQDDILTKVDRATMSCSLEGREPLLDHRLLEYAAALPFGFKSDTKRGKLILRDIVHEIIPKRLMERPKRGFTLPIGKWLRGPLRYLIDDYMSDACIAQSGFFSIEGIRRLVVRFNSGDARMDEYVWRILQFQMWRRHWIP